MQIKIQSKAKINKMKFQSLPQSFIKFKWDMFYFYANMPFLTYKSP